MKSKHFFLLSIFIFFASLISCAQQRKYQSASKYNPADRNWEKGADARIEQYRKGDIQINIVDENGNPVKGVDVKLTQTGSTFIFGSAVSASLLLSQNSTGEHFRDIVKSHFNQIVFENDLKWENWNRSPRAASNIGKTAEAMQWLKENNIKIRGHYLAWAPIREYSFYKSSITREQHDDPAQYRVVLMDHIKDILNNTKGYITEWDAVNHIATTSQRGQQMNLLKGRRLLLEDYVGEDVYPAIFSLAKKEIPNATLFVNEQILPGNVKPYFNDRYYAAISRLKDAGADIGGIGFMGHFKDSTLVPMDTLHGIFAKFSTLGLPIKVTEFDVRFGNERQVLVLNPDQLQIQKQFTADFLKLAFSEPSVTGVLIWGFWEGKDWYPSAALYNQDWSIKPNGKAWEDLVLHAWRTNVNETTNANGVVNIRGFVGSYNVKVVTKTGKQIEQTFLLDTSGKTITIKL